MEQQQSLEESGNGATSWDEAAAASEEAQKELSRDVEELKKRCVEKRTYSTLRRIPLDVSEIAQLGQKMAGKLGEIETLEDERKEISSQIKELKDGVKETRSELQSGRGERRIEVLELHDEERAHVYLIRTDTNEIVEDRTMTAAERQGELSYEASAEPDDLEEGDDDSDDEQDDEDEADEDELED